jgi:hypothetical protein
MFKVTQKHTYITKVPRLVGATSVRANVTQVASDLFRQKLSTPRRVVKRGSDSRRLGKCGWNVKLNTRLNPVPRTQLYVYYIWQVNNQTDSVNECIVTGKVR